jgi:hypothetical protein
MNDKIVNITSHVEEAREHTYRYELRQAEANDLLHLSLTVLTLGLWAVPWIFISVRVTDARNEIHEKYNRPTEPCHSFGMVSAIALLLIALTGWSMWLLTPLIDFSGKLRASWSYVSK